MRRAYLIFRREDRFANKLFYMSETDQYTNESIKELNERTDLILDKYATELSDHVSTGTPAGQLELMEKVRDAMNGAEKEFLDVANEILERDNGETEGLKEQI